MMIIDGSSRLHLLGTLLSESPANPSLGQLQHRSGNRSVDASQDSKSTRVGNSPLLPCSSLNFVHVSITMVAGTPDLDWSPYLFEDIVSD